MPKDIPHRDIIATLYRAGERELAHAYAQQHGLKIRPATAITRQEQTERGWDKISAAWKKANTTFQKVLKANENDVLAYDFLKKSHKKALSDIESALKKISEVISDNADAI